MCPEIMYMKMLNQLHVPNNNNYCDDIMQGVGPIDEITSKILNTKIKEISKENLR